MDKYEFKLTPAFCLYNGIAVMNQNGASIKFIIEDRKNELLKRRIEKAFANFVLYVTRQNNCPSEYRNEINIEFVEGDRKELRRFVSKLYTNPIGNLELEKNLEKNPDGKNDSESAAVVLLDAIITDARNRNATDIHIEHNQIRFRVCGKLELFSTVDSEKSKELVQRIKFLAGMNVLEKKKSQDGHFIYGNEKPVFLRVSSMGIIGDNFSVQEESIVIRLLDTNRMPLFLENLGFTENQLAKINSICEKKNGLVIICGPTGAGKSTTAASMLLQIKKNKNNSLKIISLEDPPEYYLPGVTQIQIDNKNDKSFDQALKYIFRQDPDVLMIGEIRDEISAATAVRAALTGHLVFATVHTASAAGAILRLENLGISRTLICSVVRGIISQQLNHCERRVELLADVSIPDGISLERMNRLESEDKLDDLFEHTTNYREAINRTINELKKKQKVTFAETEKENERLVPKKRSVFMPLHKKDLESEVV